MLKPLIILSGLHSLSMHPNNIPHFIEDLNQIQNYPQLYQPH
jgi:hypothetical protein